MRTSGSLLNGLVTLVVISLIIIWGVTALTNGDPLWFLGRVRAQAQSFTIYWDGETVEVTEADPRYGPLMAAFSHSAADIAGFEWRVALSEESITRYKADFRMLEVRFEEPIQLHTRHPFPKSATYLIPLDRTHAEWRRLFAYPGSRPYTSGPLNIGQDAFTSLYTAAEAAVASQSALSGTSSAPLN